MSDVKINAEKLKKLYQVAYFYDLRNRGGLAGQALTNFVCIRCDQESIWPNTNTPILCEDCRGDIRKEYKRDQL